MDKPTPEEFLDGDRTIDGKRIDDGSEELVRMNEKHAVVSIAGKTRVLTSGEDPVFRGRKAMSFSTLKDFEALHDKYRITTLKAGKPVETGLGTWWIQNPQRLQYDGGIRFMPTLNEEAVGDVLNLWQGFHVAAQKPDGKSGASGCRLFSTMRAKSSATATRNITTT